MEDGTVRLQVEMGEESGRRVNVFMTEHTIMLIGGHYGCPKDLAMSIWGHVHTVANFPFLNTRHASLQAYGGLWTNHMVITP